MGNCQNLFTQRDHVRSADQVDAFTEKKLLCRVIAAFQDSTFQCDSAALSQALDRDGATVHYCLVARHDSAQMGHVDVIKLIVTDTSGRIVAMTKPQYSMDYPCRFIDGTTWKYDFLF